MSRAEDSGVSANRGQTLSDIANPTISVNNNTSEKPADPMQMLAFDNMRKLDGVKTVLFGLGIVQLILTIGVFYVVYNSYVEAKSYRVQYDKLRYIASELQEVLDKVHLESK